MLTSRFEACPLLSVEATSDSVPVPQPLPDLKIGRPRGGKSCTFTSRAAALMLISAGCALAVGCGGGSTPGSAVVGGVAPTQNPLVAQFTIASACAGPGMVEFGPDTNYSRSTAWSALPGSFLRSSILVAGMRASTTYHMRAQVQCDNETLSSPDTTFTTGPLPSLAFPAITCRAQNPFSQFAGESGNRDDHSAVRGYSGVLHGPRRQPHLVLRRRPGETTRLLSSYCQTDT